MAGDPVRESPPHSGTPGNSRLSRMAGVILLAAAVAVQVWGGPHDGPPWRRLWFDTLQQVMPRERAAQPAVVVAVDESSLAQIGQWPWPRHYIAELIRLLDAAGSRAIALDMIFSEVDRLSPEVIVNWIGLQDPNAVAALKALGDTDVALAQAMRAAPVALAAAGVRAAGQAPEHPPIGPRVILEDVDSRAFPIYGHGIGPIDLFRPVAAGFGAVTFEPGSDSVLRRLSLIQNIVGRPYLLLGAEARRVAGGAAVARVRPGGFGLTVDLGEVSMPAESNGDFWVHMGRFDPARYVSALDVFTNDRGALDKIKGRIALIAVTGLGTVDLRLTPLREPVYGIEAHMQVLEQIAEQRFLRRPVELFLVEIGLTLALGLLAILLITRAMPQTALLALLASASGLAGLSAIAFRYGLLVDTASPVLAGGAIAAVMTGFTLIERDRARLLAEIALARSRAAAARVEAELAAAGEIQQGLLPPASRQVEGRLDLACEIRPARHVGGDFYDHFMIDDRRLFFVVGDVSGKGIEASLFMGLSKALWKSVALRPDQSLERLQAAANAEISRDNSSMMFVTGIVGILDLHTGDLTYSSAGHETPYVFRSGTAPQRLPECAGPPAGLDPDAAFPIGTTRLEPGDGICLFSDGVSEAENAKRDLYGVDRLGRCLAALPASTPAQAVVDAVRDDVAAFAGTAPQSDDLTLMVVIRPRGPAQ